MGPTANRVEGVPLSRRLSLIALLDRPHGASPRPPARSRVGRVSSRVVAHRQGANDVARLMRILLDSGHACTLGREARSLPADR